MYYLIARLEGAHAIKSGPQLEAASAGDAKNVKKLRERNWEPQAEKSSGFETFESNREEWTSFLVSPQITRRIEYERAIGMMIEQIQFNSIQLAFMSSSRRILHFASHISHLADRVVSLVCVGPRWLVASAQDKGDSRTRAAKRPRRRSLNERAQNQLAALILTPGEAAPSLASEVPVIFGTRTPIWCSSERDERLKGGSEISNVSKANHILPARILVANVISNWYSGWLSIAFISSHSISAGHRLQALSGRHSHTHWKLNDSDLIWSDRTWIKLNWSRPAFRVAATSPIRPNSYLNF